MATKKKLLQAAAGSAGGAGGLNVEDVFSTYVYEGNGSSQVIENGINLGQSNSGGGIYFPDGDGDYLQTATLPSLSGEFTIEFWFYSYDSDRAIYLIGNGSDENNFVVKTDYLSSSGLVYITVAGTSVNGNASSYLDIDGWNHLAITRNSSNVVSSYVNGSRIGTATISGNLNSTTYNIGAVGGGTVSGAGYELMYGYMSSVRISDTARYDPTSTSLTVPTSAFTSDSNTVLLVGQGDTPLSDASSNSYSVTVNGNPRASEVGPFDAAEAGEGGLVWTKGRNYGVYGGLTDTENGGQYTLYSAANNALVDRGSDFIMSFNANGYTIGADGLINEDTYDFASWTFRKAPKFFDVVTYTGTGSGGLVVNHNLGATPGMIVVKKTSDTGFWRVWHTATGNAYGNLDLTSSFFTGAQTVWGDGSSYVAPTDTSFTVGTDHNVNSSGQTYVAYLFAHNNGDGEFGPTGDQDIIKCGSYTGNNSTDGPEIDLGFEPQWLMIKKTNAADYWVMVDNMRGVTTGGNDNVLKANASDVELTTLEWLNFTPTGFKLTNNLGQVNDNGNFIYIAIRRGPMAVPESATDVFSIELNNGTGAYSEYTGWPVDLVIQNDRTGTYGVHRPYDRVRGGKYLETSSTNGEGTAAFGFDNSTGYSSSSSISAVDWVWRRAPSYFDVVAYTGNSTAGRTVSHNLGVAPEMMWVKRRDTASGTGWFAYHKDLTSAAYYLNVNSTAAESQYWNAWNSTAPTSSVFSLGNYSDVNLSGGTYIAYLFASLDGVSKVGSYTGTGAALDVDCGFSSGARFVMIKRADAAGSWEVWDTERGIVSGSEGLLRLNSTAAEITADWLDPYSGGFQVSALGPNAVGGTYIFYATS